MLVVHSGISEKAMLTAERGMTYGGAKKRQTSAANPASTEVASLTKCQT